MGENRTFWLRFAAIFYFLAWHFLLSFFLTDGNRKVAFTAAVTSSSTTWNSGNLIFNRIISNLGNGYNRRTGVFTAPVAGTYVFYVSVNEYHKLGIGLEIVLNNVSKVRLIGYSDSAHQTGTNMVVLNLQKNDGVCVRRYWGKGYYTYSDIPLTTFSGFII